MITLGLTGNRYSGKTTVAKQFKSIGVPVFDADLILRFILNYNYELLGMIKKDVGSHIFVPTSKNELLLDLRTISKEDFDKVIDYIEDDIFRAYKRFNDTIEATGGIYTIFKSSILFERNWDKKLDMVLNIFATDGDRLKRGRALTNLGLLKVKELIATEMEGTEKNEDSDFIIYNHNVDFGSSAVSSSIVKEVNKVDQKIIDEYLYSETIMY